MTQNMLNDIKEIIKCHTKITSLILSSKNYTCHSKAKNCKLFSYNQFYSIITYNNYVSEFYCGVMQLIECEYDSLFYLG